MEDVVQLSPPVDISGSVPVTELSAELTLQAALDVSPDGFAVHRVVRGRDGRAMGFVLEAINAAGAAPHAAGPADLLGRDLVELLPDPEATGIPAVFRAAADTGVVQSLRTAFDSDDWSGVMDLLVARIDEDRIVATWRDVSDLVQTEQVLIDAYTTAQAAWDCLYGVLDAVEDEVLLVRVSPRDTTPGGGAPAAISVAATDPLRGARRQSLVVEYLNAAAAGARDRGALSGRALSQVRPDLELDAVVDLVAAAASDRPGCVRRLVLTSIEGTELASFTASPAPAAVTGPAAAGGPDAPGPVDPGDRRVVLVVRQPSEQA